MDLKSAKVNSVLIEAGEWVKDIPGMDDLALKVRGLGCIEAKNFMSRRVRALPKGTMNRDGTFPPALQERLLTEQCIEVLLLDWENLTEDKTTVPYSKEKARELLTNPDYRPLKDAVLWAANTLASGEALADGEILGNSPPTSNGSTAGAEITTSSLPITSE
ncbi:MULTISPECIES: hypothetical protein [unclassified Chelatococcus]|uniref:hypothetical protein n=1 Tax=unclassified Chelatococcus TaxID=2638111 RepID=UPI001BCEE8FD|nr:MULTISPECIES: hypothetical protein [unclassified Chelatococcus]MBS7696270.1 hypothetical protein [Chelatococcus sp. YT9]MBX3560055.1 hypothetical protein [Chelatococcus sp.]